MHNPLLPSSPLNPLNPAVECIITHGQHYWNGWHAGWDLISTKGTTMFDPVYAAEGGEVVFVGRRPVWGWIVVIQHATVWTRYGHLWLPAVLLGDRVAAGQIIGQVGAGEDNKMEPHLHFDILTTEPQDWGYWPSDLEGLRYFADPALH